MTSFHQNTPHLQIQIVIVSGCQCALEQLECCGSSLLHKGESSSRELGSEPLFMMMIHLFTLCLPAYLSDVGALNFHTH